MKKDKLEILFLVMSMVSDIRRQRLNNCTNLTHNGDVEWPSPQRVWRISQVFVDRSFYENKYLR